MTAPRTSVTDEPIEAGHVPHRRRENYERLLVRVDQLGEKALEHGLVHRVPQR